MKQRKSTSSHVLPRGFGGGVKLSKPIIVDDHSFLQVIVGEKSGTIGAVVGRLPTDAPVIKPIHTPKA